MHSINHDNPTILVVAHPDDECMFFTPCLLNFPSVTVLCLTDGGYRGAKDGMIRRLEMERSCKEVFGVEDVVIAEIEGVKDTPIEGEWEGREVEIVSLIEATLKGLSEKSKATSNVNILTFDDGGVSGHCNHCDCSKIVSLWFDALPSPCKLGASTSSANVRLFQLRTIEPYLKYGVHLGYPRFTLPYWVHGGSGEYVVTNGEGMEMARRGMEMHRSQYVWYRRLFVYFSCYVCTNVLVERRQRGQNYHNNRGKSVGALAVLGAMIALNIAGRGLYPNAAFILLSINRYFQWLGGELFRRNG